MGANFKKKIHEYPPLKASNRNVNLSVTPWNFYLNLSDKKEKKCSHPLAFFLSNSDWLLAKKNEGQLAYLARMESVAKIFKEHPDYSLTPFFLSLIYLKFENFSAAEIELKKFLRNKLYGPVNNPCVLSFSDSQILSAKIQNSFIFYLYLIKQTLKNDDVDALLATYFEDYGLVESTAKLKILGANKWTIKEFNQKIKQLSFGREILAAWIPWMMANLSSVEMWDIFEKYLDEKAWRTQFIDLIPILSFYYPKDEKRRLSISGELAKLPKDSFFKAYGSIFIAENSLIKQSLKEEFWQKPTFQIVRQSAHSMLNMKQACAFSFYKLISLGDEANMHLERFEQCP